MGIDRESFAIWGSHVPKMAQWLQRASEPGVTLQALSESAAVTASDSTEPASESSQVTPTHFSSNTHYGVTNSFPFMSPFFLS